MRQFLLLALLCLSAAPALAQYQWVDQSGQMVFSDQPPPATVPLSRILRVGDPIARPSLPANKAARRDEQSTDDSQPLSKAEKLADSMKQFAERRAAKAESKKKAQEAKLATASKAQRCARLKSRMASIESGVRMTRRDANGEQTFLSDRERSALGTQTRKHLAGCN